MEMLERLDQKRESCVANVGKIRCWWRLEGSLWGSWSRSILSILVKVHARNLGLILGFRILRE